MKSLDGNLNTATKHLYEMTRKSKNHIQHGNVSELSMQSKGLNVVVQVDESKFTAVGWNFDAIGLTIDSVKDAQGNLISTTPNELIIED